MLLHLKLLTQMVGHFYEAKRREQVQRQSACAQATRETGVRQQAYRVWHRADAGGRRALTRNA